jgi:hypothetical protein
MNLFNGGQDFTMGASTVDENVYSGRGFNLPGFVTPMNSLPPSQHQFGGNTGGMVVSRDSMQRLGPDERTFFEKIYEPALFN